MTQHKLWSLVTLTTGDATGDVLRLFETRVVKMGKYRHSTGGRYSSFTGVPTNSYQPDTLHGDLLKKYFSFHSTI